MNGQETQTEEAPQAARDQGVLMAAVVSSQRAAPKARVPRSWARERIVPTHFIYNGVTERGGKGAGKGTVDIASFGCGWRTVHLESEGRKWAHVVECGTGTRAKVDLDTWHMMVRHGRVMGDGK